MAAEIRLFPCLSDNFGYLIHDPATKATASIDAPEAAPVIAALEREGWQLTDVCLDTLTYCQVALKSPRFSSVWMHNTSADLCQTANESLSLQTHRPQT